MALPHDLQLLGGLPEGHRGHEGDRRGQERRPQGTPVGVPQLLVAAGPIAAGKSTVASEVAARAVSAGWTVASADLDEVARMAHFPAGREGESWEASHGPHAALVGTWLREPVDLVIAHGSLYTMDHLAALRAAAPTGTRILTVLLRVGYQTALRRALADPSRGLSRDPDFLRHAHGRFEERLAASGERPDLEFDTGLVDLDAILTAVADALGIPVVPAGP